MALRVMGFWRSGRRQNSCMNVSPQVAKDVGTNAVFDLAEEDDDDEDSEE